MLLNDITFIQRQARTYVEKCCKVLKIEGKTIVGFSEHMSKQRITAWGGTSSALRLFSITGNTPDQDIEEKVKKAKQWLVNDQKEEGSWEASGMPCCEATAGVIYDVGNRGVLSEVQIEKAKDFINSCYSLGSQGGFFRSRPDIREVNVHLYTTFLAVRALWQIGKIEPGKKEEIKAFIRRARASDGRWGGLYQEVRGTVEHTVMALLVLYYCGEPREAIKSEYENEIRWLRKQTRNCSKQENMFAQEETKAVSKYYYNGQDQYGEKEWKLNTHHFKLALMCKLFLILGEYDYCNRLIVKMIKIRETQGGWGRTTEGNSYIWATLQAVEAMHDFETLILGGRKASLSTRVKLLTYKVPHFWIRTAFFVLAIPSLIYFIISGMLAEIALNAMFILFTWFVDIDD